MCVIVHNEGDQLSGSEVCMMWARNSHGIGLITRQGEVIKAAGLSKSVKNRCRKAAAVHFRLASSGAGVGDLKGVHPHKSAWGWLMHNGHIGALDRSYKCGDTRAVCKIIDALSEWRAVDAVLGAFAAGGNRFLLRDRAGEFHRWGHWEQLRAGLWVSNTHWQPLALRPPSLAGVGSRVVSRGWCWDDDQLCLSDA